MKYTLRQLEIFLAVARHENISRAAQTLNMSQSAASEALLTLEHNYDVQLFERVRNRLVLSAVGNSLRKEAQSLLRQCQSFEESLTTHRSLGHLKVGASLTIGNHLASGYLAAYLKKFPEADVQLEIASTPEVVAKVLNYEFDIGMIEAELKHRDLQLLPWRDDELAVFCAADHPLAGKKVLSRADIRAAEWILREPDSGARRTFDRAMAGLLPEIHIFLEFKHNEAIKNAVASGLGIGCLSRIVLQQDFDNGGLVPLELPRVNMRRTFYFALPKKRFHTRALDVWMQTCIESDARPGLHGGAILSPSK